MINVIFSIWVMPKKCWPRYVTLKVNKKTSSGWEYLLMHASWRTQFVLVVPYQAKRLSEDWFSVRFRAALTTHQLFLRCVVYCWDTCFSKRHLKTCFSIMTCLPAMTVCSRVPRRSVLPCTIFHFNCVRISAIANCLSTFLARCSIHFPNLSESFGDGIHQ